MKLIINYDFFNEINNVNNPLTPLKIIRNNSFRYCYLVSVWSIINIFEKASLEHDLQRLLLWGSMYLAFDYTVNFSFFKKFDNMDIYAYRANMKLRKLPSLLNDINVKTDYDMLLQSELYEKNYKIEKNDNKSFSLTERKYIYVPSYGYNGEENETSILQEHDIGSNIYTLSVEEPEKRYRRVLVNNMG